ncbi:MAG TPA: ribulokinase [Pseudonocardiaceae bacterium]|nr:ribulokinase [Pseudonocardiaceae bacterium]
MDDSPRYVVGVDFGTLSGRALVVRVSDGAEMGEAEYRYPHGVLDTALPGSDRDLPPDWALQHPDDWLGVLRHAVPAAVADSGVDPAAVIGIGLDTTACTVLPTDPAGHPLCLEPRWAAEPHAWPKLWKHHSAQPHADRLNALAHERGEPWIARYGGKISAEWQFAKALEVLTEAPDVYAATARWIEAADWIVWQLTGTESRNRATAGYKGIHQDGRYPDRDFLAALHPDFADFAATRLDHPLADLGSRAGGLTEAAARWTGLPAGTAVAAGNIDAHVTAPAVQAVEPGRLLAVMGTSTCLVVNGSELTEVPGMCGVVDGGIVAGSYGYEAGQSGVGDIFAWFTENAVPARYERWAAEEGVSPHELLTRLGAGRPVGAHGLVALDWWNGNRSVLVDHALSGLVVGMTLATRPEDVYRALLEATAFGARRIVAAFRDSAVPVTEFVVAGGLLRNTELMRIYADVLGLPLSVSESAQAPALGSAIHAAVAAGAYPDVPAASKAMGRVRRAAYRPDADRHARYDRLYADYLRLHDHFGRGGDDVMRRLRRMREEGT